MSILNELTWIDWTSLAVVAYFLIMGLFRGFIWQVSRLASLLLAYLLATLFAASFSAFLVRHVSGLEGGAGYYVAYFTIFLAVLVVLGLVTLLLDRFVRKLELGFYNHLGGGLLGLATAAALIVGLLGLAYRVLPAASFVVHAKESYTGDVSRFLVNRVPLPAEIRSLYRLPEKKEQGPTEPGPRGK